MTTAEKKLRAALRALRIAESWNRADIEGFDDISPNMPMLEARQRVLRAAIAKVKGAKS